MLPNTGMLSVIASPRRQEILRLIWSQERAAGDVACAMPDVTFGAVSLQLRALRDAGLVRVRVEAKHRYYQAIPVALGPLAVMLEAMWNDALWSLKLAAELEESRRGPRGRRRRANTRVLPKRSLR